MAPFGSSPHCTNEVDGAGLPIQSGRCALMLLTFVPAHAVDFAALDGEHDLDR